MADQQAPRLAAAPGPSEPPRWLGRALLSASSVAPVALAVDAVAVAAHLPYALAVSPDMATGLLTVAIGGIATAAKLLWGKGRSKVQLPQAPASPQVLVSPEPPAAPPAEPPAREVRVEFRQHVFDKAAALLGYALSGVPVGLLAWILHADPVIGACALGFYAYVGLLTFVWPDPTPIGDA